MRTGLDDPPYEYYSGDKVAELASSKHYQLCQRQLSQRAIEILNFPDDTCPKMVLDVGCGTGMTVQVVSELGHVCVGTDIAPEMMLSAQEAVSVEGIPNCYARVDAGIGLPFRAGVFDAAIGIDLLRWLFRRYDGQEVVSKRLRIFLESLHGCLRCGSRAVFNFNPETADQAQMLVTLATKCGFGGGIHTDFPNSTNARVDWLVLEVGGMVEAERLNEAFTQPGVRIAETAVRYDHHKKKGFDKKSWIEKKKERQRLLGKNAAHDSKYTGRVRRKRSDFR